MDYKDLFKTIDNGTRLTFELDDSAGTLTAKTATRISHHSDRRGQYTSEQFQRLMAYHGVICSMSRSDNVWDNAAMENLFSSLKTELTARKTYRVLKHRRAAGALALHGAIGAPFAGWSKAKRAGVRLEVTEAVLNHISGSRSIAGVYQQHDWAAEKRAALDAWAQHVVSIVEGRMTAGNVVTLARARAEAMKKKPAN